MSLTGTHHVSISVAETGINTFIKAVCTARARFINYGTSLFVPATTASATNMPTIPFPGVPGGIQWAVSLSIPVLDLFPDSSGGASPLPPMPNAFNVHTHAKVFLGCATWVGRDIGTVVPVSTDLDVWALGEIVPTFLGPGNGFISFKVDSVKLPGIKPDGLEAVLECLLRMILAAALGNIMLPFQALSVGAFTLTLQQGPEIADNQMKVFGDIT